jgi:hypothetical protein
METIGKQTFTDETLVRIRETVRADPGISRRKLSQRICEWLNWRNPAGRLQDMSCRKAMQELERRKLIELPPVTERYAFHQPRPRVAPPPLAVLACPLADLGEIEIIPVRGKPELQRWTAMMDAHHYLTAGPLCGAQLRYWIRCPLGILGGLSYSACALRVTCRDDWIGWTEDARKRNQALVVNNSRFLIAPTVKVPNLASHALARAQARLADDWEKAYAYRPVLLETYVERGRFAGTCYQAANWTHCGVTVGRGRQGTGAARKDVYVRPLTTDWQAVLCKQADGTVQVRSAAPAPAPKDWIEAELGGANLGDRRLTARLLQMTGQFYAQPLANIPQACGSVHAAKAAYRFLDNEAVDWQAILQPHYDATEERVRNQKVVLVAQDTTTLNYSSHPHTQGLGPIGNEREEVRGLLLHDTLAFTPSGVPLGLLAIQAWAREGIGSKHTRHLKPIEEKESWKWIESYRAVSQVQKRCQNTRLVVVADREADIHEVFAEQAKTRHGAQLLIRAERSRKRQVEDEAGGHEELWALLERQPLLGSKPFLVPPSGDRPARQAVLGVYASPVTLRPPKRKAELPPVKAWAVLAREMSPPEGVEGLEWLLLTTVEVKGCDDALERLEWYARRWGIEVYHRILKSGCRVESRQLENAQRLLNALAIDLVVAWRIFHLTMQGEETPEVPCTVYFTESEWKGLTTFTSRSVQPPQVPPSLQEAVRLLATLGGHLGRPGDGRPGAEVLWRGMTRLADIEAAYELYHE